MKLEDERPKSVWQKETPNVESSRDDLFSETLE